MCLQNLEPITQKTSEGVNLLLKEMEQALYALI